MLHTSSLTARDISCSICGHFTSTYILRWTSSLIVCVIFQRREIIQTLKDVQSSLWNLGTSRPSFPICCYCLFPVLLNSSWSCFNAWVTFRCLFLPNSANCIVIRLFSPFCEVLSKTHHVAHKLFECMWHQLLHLWSLYRNAHPAVEKFFDCVRYLLKEIDMFSTWHWVVLKTHPEAPKLFDCTWHQLLHLWSLVDTVDY